MRLGDYKASFAEQRMPGTMAVWAEPFTKLRLTKLYNLMQDPFERADITSNTYWDWIMNHVPQVYQGMEGVDDVRGHVQGVPAALRPAELQPGQHDGRHAARHQGQAEDRTRVPDAPRGGGEDEGEVEQVSPDTYG